MSQNYAAVLPFLRPLMKPGPGCVMIKADYKQIQMRIPANLSNDPELVAAFREGQEVHSLTVEMCGIQEVCMNVMKSKGMDMDWMRDMMKNMMG